MPINLFEKGKATKIGKRHEKAKVGGNKVQDHAIKKKMPKSREYIKTACIILLSQSA